MNTRISKFGWLTKIRSMQLGGCCIKCFGADINCFIPYKEVKFSNIVLSPVFMSSTDQDFDLALKLPSDITK